MAKHLKGQEKVNCDREFIAGTSEFKACMERNAAIDAEPEAPAKNVFQLLMGRKKDIEDALRQ